MATQLNAASRLKAAREHSTPMLYAMDKLETHLRGAATEAAKVEAELNKGKYAKSNLNKIKSILKAVKGATLDYSELSDGLDEA